MLNFFTMLDDMVWGAPLLILLVGTGIYLTVRLGLLQVLKLPKAFKLIFADDKGQGIFLVLPLLLLLLQQQ